MPQTDAAAVALARDGDSEAFRALVERHSRAVFRLAQRMTGSPNFGTWLHRIAVNCSIDLIRSRANRETGHEVEDLEQFGAASERTDAMSSSPERLMLSSEVQDRVQAAMASLSAMERAAFALRHFEGQSIEEISRALGLKTNAAKHSVFRAVRKMRVALEPFVAAD
jgi:RNA polymerase sigma-70 factor (ECF subfamily)